MTRRQQLGTDEEAKKRQQQDGTDGKGRGRRGKGKGRGRGRGRGKGGKKVASPKSKMSPKAKASPKAKTSPKGKAKANASPKSKAKATAAKSKPKASPSKTPKEPEPEKVKREGGGKRLSKGQEGEQPKKARGQESATWAGRWVPTEGVALKKFNSIRSVFMECVQPRLQSPSSFQKLFFKICSQAFKHGDVTDDSPEADFIALAELQVDELFQQDVVRSSSKFVTIWCLLVIRSP